MNIILQKLHDKSEKYVEEAVRNISENYEKPADLEEAFDLEYYDEKGKKLSADMYRPADQNGRLLPVVIFIHGGGFFSGNKRNNRFFCENLSRMGYVVYSVEYRLIVEANGLEEISDICNAFEFVKQNAKEHGGDLSQVFAFGESAGACLALYTTAMTRCRQLREQLNLRVPDIQIKGLICSSGMFYPAGKDLIGMVYKKDLYGDRIKNKEFMDLMNPENSMLIKSLPPVFIISSRGDFLRNYSLRYAKKLEEEGHPVKLVYYKDSKHLRHAFATLAPFLPESAEVMGMLREWADTIE